MTARLLNYSCRTGSCHYVVILMEGLWELYTEEIVTLWKKMSMKFENNNEVNVLVFIHTSNSTETRTQTQDKGKFTDNTFVFNNRTHIYLTTYNQLRTNFHLQ